MAGPFHANSEEPSSNYCCIFFAFKKVSVHRCWTFLTNGLMPLAQPYKYWHKKLPMTPYFWCLKLSLKWFISSTQIDGTYKVLGSCIFHKEVKNFDIRIDPNVYYRTKSSLRNGNIIERISLYFASDAPAKQTSLKYKSKSLSLLGRVISSKVWGTQL